MDVSPLNIRCASLISLYDESDLRILIAEWIPNLNKGELVIVIGMLRTCQDFGRSEGEHFLLAAVGRQAAISQEPRHHRHQTGFGTLRAPRRRPRNCVRP
jgi:hypothetical protein